MISLKNLFWLVYISTKNKWKINDDDLNRKRNRSEQWNSKKRNTLVVLVFLIVHIGAAAASYYYFPFASTVSMFYLRFAMAYNVELLFTLITSWIHNSMVSSIIFVWMRMRMCENVPKTNSSQFVFTNCACVHELEFGFYFLFSTVCRSHNHLTAVFLSVNVFWHSFTLVPL